MRCSGDCCETTRERADRLHAENIRLRAELEQVKETIKHAMELVGYVESDEDLIEAITRTQQGWSDRAYRAEVGLERAQAERDAAENRVWDEVVAACRQYGREDYAQSPVELIYQLGDERDEARDALARLREVAKKADALLHDLRMASSRDDVWMVVAYDRVERAHKALAREVGP